MANEKAVTDPQGARSLGQASYSIAWVGIVVSVVVAVIYFSMLTPSGSAGSGRSCTYTYKGRCYRYFSSYMTSSECALKNGVYDDYYLHCYYN